MIIELSEEYIPNQIIHREKQVKEISSIFTNFKKTGMGTNLAILGVTGAGKTVIIKKVIEEQGQSIYINCNETKTPFKTLSKICLKKVKTQSDVLEQTIKSLRDNPRIIILDEIDKIKNLFALANDLNTIYRKTMIPIIIISFKRNIVESLPSDVRKTLFFHKLNLPSYNAIELKDILESRIKLVELELLDKLDEGRRNFICAIASKQGSARVLMNILVRCIQSNNFTQKHIEYLYEEMNKKDWRGFVEDINETEKKFLEILTRNSNCEKSIDFQFLQNKMGLSAGRISQLISIFERYDVIISHTENLGRGGGRKRNVRFKSKETYNEIMSVISY